MIRIGEHLDFLVEKQNEGHYIKELDELPQLDAWEAPYWDMAVSVYREMNSGMGCGMMLALSLYCEIHHVGDEARYDYAHCLKHCFPLKKPDK